MKSTNEDIHKTRVKIKINHLISSTSNNPKFSIIMPQRQLVFDIIVKIVYSLLAGQTCTLSYKLTSVNHHQLLYEYSIHFDLMQDPLTTYFSSVHQYRSRLHNFSSTKQARTNTSDIHGM